MTERMDPYGEKVLPSTANSFGAPVWASTMRNYDVQVSADTNLYECILLTFEMLIWLVVKVPVLSEQITLVLPSVSTLGKFRTIAFFCAIFFVPRARHAVMTAAKPSGMAATARATAILK